MSTFVGTDLADNILGTTSADIIYGLNGNDILRGERGNDTIYAGGNDDIVYGGDGNDFLDGNSGSDTLYGDGGTDVFHFSYNENLGSTDIYDGGKGNDKLVISFTESEYNLYQTSINQAVAAFNSPKAPAVFNFNKYIDTMNLSVTKIESLVINVAPKTVLDTAATNEWSPLTIDVLANDSDLNGNLLTLTSVTAPLGTSATIINNKIYFDPGVVYEYLNPGETATLVLDYSITDGYVTSSGKVNITINGDVPTTVFSKADYFKGVYFGEDANANVLANDPGALSVALAEAPEHASNFILRPDGSFDYTPQAGFFGIDNFSYRAYDGVAYSTPTTVTLDMLYHVPLRTEISIDQAFYLNSNPYATKTIFLDFDGHITTNTGWNTSTGIDEIVTPAYDSDGNTTSFSTAELNSIIDMWYQVQEDFAPFNVNVTTLDLSSIDPNWLINTGSGDTNWGSTVAIGGSYHDWYGSPAGGISYVFTFGSALYNTAFVFEDNLGSPKNISESISHEAGHIFGLQHDGTTYSEYYSGNSLWAPIMGTGYYSQVTQWSKGEYPNADNREDDLLAINARTGFRIDDHVNDSSNLSLITPIKFDFSQVSAGTEVLGAQGIIESTQDVDVFRFEVDAAHNNTFDLSIAANSIYPNLNIESSLQHFDTNGTLISTQASNPLNNMSASFDNLAEGSYILSIAGVGEGDPLNGGYSDYGSLGNYNIFGVG